MSEPERPGGEQPQRAYSVEELPALYQRALETGDAAELVRALCQVHGVNLRGLAELTGVSQRALGAWVRQERSATRRAVEDLQPLLKPSKAVLRQIGAVRQRFPIGLRGRPNKARRAS